MQSVPMLACSSEFAAPPLPLPIPSPKYTDQDISLSVLFPVCAEDNRHHTRSQACAHTYCIHLNLRDTLLRFESRGQSQTGQSPSFWLH